MSSIITFVQYGIEDISQMTKEYIGDLFDSVQDNVLERVEDTIQPIKKLVLQSDTILELVGLKEKEESYSK
jgi:hypothetical protein